MNQDDSLTEAEHATNDATWHHIHRVNELLMEVVKDLIGRGVKHDQSKLKPPEVPIFTEYTDKLKGCTFGSPEYEGFKKAMKPALDHHYANNSHHPEYTEFHEVWKDVVGYEGIYQISDRGRVKALSREVKREKQGSFTRKEGFRKAHVTPKGYARLMLQRDGKAQNRFVHSLVAEAFISEPLSSKGLQINHKNGDKLDNTVENLEWVTPSENLQHAYDTGLKESNAKYVIRCKELDIVTIGCVKMEKELRGRGYEKASSASIYACIAYDKNHTHLDLTFESWNVQEYKELNSPVNDMSLIDLVEMLVDWKAASERHNDGNINKSIEINGKRFEMSPQLIKIFENTAKQMFSK